MRRFARLSCCPVLAILYAPALSQGLTDASWPAFRGASSAGVASTAKNLPVVFGPEVNLRWRVAASSGHSSPIVCGDRILVSGHAENEVDIQCFDLGTGKRLWRRAVEVEAFENVHRVNSRASSTPTTDGKCVCVYFGSFGLLCYDLDGTELWRRRMEQPKNMFGSASSPTIRPILNASSTTWTRLPERIKTGREFSRPALCRNHRL